MSRRRSQDGFTLLEVMVALAILALALTVVSQAQQASMRQVLRAKMMTVATLLARGKMVELEDDLFKKGFSDFEEEEKGDFDEEGFRDYQWTLRVEKIELPQTIDPTAMADADGAGSGSGSAAGPSTGIGMLGGQMLGKQFEMFRNVLEQAIRRVSLKVHWKEGRLVRAITVVGYFTDPRKIDIAAGGLGGLTGTTDTTTGTGTGSTALPGTTSRTPTVSPTTGTRR